MKVVNVLTILILFSLSSAAVTDDAGAADRSARRAQMLRQGRNLQGGDGGDNGKIDK